MARVRTFIGVELGDAIRSRMRALQSEFAAVVEGVKWVEPENLHVTLLFLGEVDDRDLPAVCRAVAEAAGREPPAPFHVSGLGAFPNARRPRTLWAGVTEGAETLIRLHDGIEERLIQLGDYRREDRPFHPHVTLGRLRENPAGHEMAAVLSRYRDWDGGQGRLDEVVVFSSELGRSGPVYTPLGRATLEGLAGSES